MADITLDTATLVTLGGTIGTALGVLWGVRKALGLIGR
jgi:hypothetical protein